MDWLITLRTTVSMIDHSLISRVKEIVECLLTRRADQDPSKRQLMNILSQNRIMNIKVKYKSA